MITFGDVIEALKNGKRAHRKGWNGIKAGLTMFIYIEKGKILENFRGPARKWVGESIEVHSHFNMVGADGKLVSGWLASQTDMVSEDWVISD